VAGCEKIAQNVAQSLFDQNWLVKFAVEKSSQNLCNFQSNFFTCKLTRPDTALQRIP
jgi:hypothetical protein